MKKMVPNLVNAVNDRFKSNFWLAFLGVFLICNWRLMVAFLKVGQYADTGALIDELVRLWQYESSFDGSVTKNIFWWLFLSIIAYSFHVALRVVLLTITGLVSKFYLKAKELNKEDPLFTQNQKLVSEIEENLEKLANYRNNLNACQIELEGSKETTKKQLQLIENLSNANYDLRKSNNSLSNQINLPTDVDDLIEEEYVQHSDKERSENAEWELLNKKAELMVKTFENKMAEDTKTLLLITEAYYRANKIGPNGSYIKMMWLEPSQGGSSLEDVVNYARKSSLIELKSDHFFITPLGEHVLRKLES